QYKLNVDGTSRFIGTSTFDESVVVKGNFISTSFSLVGSGVSSIVAGVVTALYFYGDGSNITNVNVSAAGWTNVGGILYNTLLGNVGIGTSVSGYPLEVGVVGSSSTSLYVNGIAKFVGIITTNNIYVGGAITATSYNFAGGTGKINAGIVTSTNLSVGVGGTAITTVSIGSSVGIGTTSPRVKFDVEGHTRLKSYSENVGTLTISSNIVTIDLSVAQTFNLTLTSNVSSFTLINVPNDSCTFTLKITQDSTGNRTVNIDTFNASDGVTTIPVYWPGGGVLPIMTPTASSTDIYSFKIFNGSTITSTGMYGAVGGQNFT
ncbi:hypothetical protein EBQ91_01165, partial [bacterium]|nr:hypothetical protein [bacterium]